MNRNDDGPTAAQPITVGSLLQQTESYVTADDAADRADRRQQLLDWMAEEVEQEAAESVPEAPSPSPASSLQAARTSERPLADVAFLTVAETASMLRVSKMTVYRLVHSGHLPAIRVGRSFRVPQQAVHEYLREVYACEKTS
ncbi:hypothetical protein GCM10010246_56080 [Streptomyces cuspidosporus]|uniref:Helix-turn-helix domain-containing protein n=1 Tax=Streptomyces cuspidosporus TaxID=66882 RepID=A0ABP5TTY3_9ACTN